MKKKIFYCILIVFVFIFSNFAYAKRFHLEAYYQTKWCNENKGQTEFELKDLTRVDCLTDTEAVEFDFANKWAECIGQSLYYGISTNKTPACALIIEQEKDKRYIERLQTVADKLGIKVYIISDNR